MLIKRSMTWPAAVGEETCTKKDYAKPVEEAEHSRTLHWQWLKLERELGRLSVKQRVSRDLAVLLSHIRDDSVSSCKSAAAAAAAPQPSHLLYGDVGELGGAPGE